MSTTDFRAETRTRLDRSLLYARLKECAELPGGDSAIVGVVDEAVYYAFQRTKLILLAMRQYTLHDGDHLFRVLHLMESLLGQSRIARLSSAEATLLILSAFFHDIGMAPSVVELKNWRRFWDASPSVPDEWQASYLEFKAYAQAHPHHLERIEYARRAGNNSAADALIEYVISEYIRSTHADRARAIIEADWSGRVRIRDIDLTAEFAAVCFSHNEDSTELLSLEHALLVGSAEVACLPFVGVVLRLSDLLDFDAKRTPAVLFAHLAVDDPVSLAEWMKHRSVESWQIQSDKIAYRARCSHPAIEASIRRFMDYIDRELAASSAVLQNLHSSNPHFELDKYQIPLPARVDRAQVGPQIDVRGRPAYRYRDTKFHISQNRIIDLLMGTRLYGDPAVALRELLQNSIDACKFREAQCAVWGVPYSPEIRIEFEHAEAGDRLIVEDNGSGMDQSILDHHYTKIGSSFYRSAAFYRMAQDAGASFRPISRFGIGVLSCFMVANSVKVETRRALGPYEFGESLDLRVVGTDGVFWIREGERKAPGTRTELRLRSGHPWRRKTPDQLVSAITATVPTPPFPFAISIDGTPADHIDRPPLRLRNSTWRTDGPFRRLELTLSEHAEGLGGTATLALLERATGPCADVSLFDAPVAIGERTFTLASSLAVGPNVIRRYATTIELDDDTGEPHSVDQVSDYLRSQSRVSVHGIAVATDVFPDTWRRQLVRTNLLFPFPCVLDLDVRAPFDLTLNAARDQIVLDEHWVQVQRAIIRAIITGTRATVGPDYWAKLVPVWRGATLGAKDDPTIEAFRVELAASS